MVTYSSYTDVSAQDKKDLLEYCSSDEKYSDLANLILLPLVNGSFTAFQSTAFSEVYLCTSECPKWLLPNLDHKLVDDASLYSVLLQIAGSNSTQLRELKVPTVASLLDESMSLWRNRDSVVFPNSEFPSGWLAKFWNWVNNLECFKNKLIFPVHSTLNVPVTESFRVLKLSSTQPVLYFPSHSSFSDTLLSALDKLGIQYCTQANFPYVRHNQLSAFVKDYSPKALLDVITFKDGLVPNISFSTQEAALLRKDFSQISPYSSQNIATLKELRVFNSCADSLYSIAQVIQDSLLKEVIVQPTGTIDLNVLPASVIVLSSGDHYQKQLLQELGYLECDGVDFLTRCIFPNLSSMGNHYMDDIMTKVLDLHPTLVYSQKSTITSALKELYFVKISSGARLRPCDLYDPTNEPTSLIFQGEDVFPSAPYHSSQYINVLKLCGLRTAVDPQTTLNLINTISLPESSTPQTLDALQLKRVRAILSYVASSSFQAPDCYIISGSSERISFATALMQLSKRKSWLPVLSERPANYPPKLPWKGEGYSSHVISLGNSACASTSRAPAAPLLYGSQAYFTEVFDSVEADEPKHCLVPHFQKVMALEDDLTPDETLDIVQKIYSAMLSIDSNPFEHTKEWVYIKNHHKFVSLDSVALKQNSGFRHSLEPYLHILPDSISGYSELFKKFGMTVSLSESQIASVIGTMRREISTDSCRVSAEEAWSLILSILNWLTENGTKTVNNCYDSIFVPAESDSKFPLLEDASKLVYTDNEFLKEFAKSTSKEKLFVHSRINQSLAKNLGVTPLSEELDISEDTFEDAGQQEPLIVRLKNILREYKKGLTIIKELIQNADDAEATEVNICFDAREHKVEQSKLFFPDMCKAHGPALVVHNNSTFSSEDFVNIQKLAGATKQNKHLKIGKFGVGFCSVYHITDVPSFISQERLYIFDPTLNHLRKAVRNTNQPGKKVNFLTKVIKQSQQMQPYEGLFGFRSDAEYKGTLFRLPFRATPSELSSTCYSEATVFELLTGIKESSDKLLLFLQNVKHITVQRFNPGMSAPEILYELSKPAPPLPSLSLGASIITVESHDWEKKNKSSNCWLVATHNSICDSKPAVASVACLLQMNSSNSYTVSGSLTGETFCFLPLSQDTGLPVHVSCNFAVINNRRGIWTTSHENVSHSDPEVEWNTFLMEEVIPVAYIQLLTDLKTMDERSMLLEYKFHSLWPRTSELQQKNPWEKCVKSVYSTLPSCKLFYSHSTKTWLSLRESKFLDPVILGKTSPHTCVQDIIFCLNLPLVELPTTYKCHLCLTKERLTEKDFIDLFFTRLTQLNGIPSSRNNVILFMLEAFASQFDHKTEMARQLTAKFGKYACIPTSPDGQVMSKCEDIVDPESSFAELFEDTEHRFPLNLFSESCLAMTALEHANMIYSSLSWELVIERAQSVEPLIKRDRVKALQRTKLLLSTISRGFVHGSPPTNGVTIDSIHFLPVIPKPEGYPLSWCGDRYTLLPGKELVLSNTYTEFGNKKLEGISGSQVAFLCEDPPKRGGCDHVDNDKTRKFLGLQSTPKPSQVIAHFKEVIAQFNSSNPPPHDWMTKTCRDMYCFFENALSQEAGNEVVILDELKRIPEFVWNGTRFINVDSVAIKWNLENGPHLYGVPPDLSSKKKLSKMLGIKRKIHMSRCCSSP